MIVARPGIEPYRTATRQTLTGEEPPFCDRQAADSGGRAGISGEELTGAPARPFPAWLFRSEKHIARIIPNSHEKRKHGTWQQTEITMRYSV